MLSLLIEHNWTWEAEQHFHFTDAPLEVILPFLLMTIIFSSLFSLLIAFIIYKDALNKGNENALLWFIFVFFTTILGVIVYVIVNISQKSPTPNIFTPVKVYNGDSVYIQAFTPKINFCRKCGNKLDVDGRFCQDCGFEVRKKV